MKIKLTLNSFNGSPFHRIPARVVELEQERILCNDISFPWESHPHRMRLWVIGNEYGPLGAVWAGHEQDAFDVLVDAGLGGGLLIEEADADEDSARLGNAGEPANLDNAWIRTVRLDPKQDCLLLVAFAEARGEAVDTLDDIRVAREILVS